MTDPKPKSTAPIDEEYVPEDDSIIGQAFKWSLLAMMLIAVVVLATLYVVNRETTVAQDIKEKEISELAILEAGAVDMPTVSFTNITDEAGIDFVHYNSATGEKLLPETMGGGAAFFDYDGDGDQDLLLINSTDWPHHDEPIIPAPTMGMYRNDGTGHFEDITSQVGLDVSYYGMGVAVGDYDNDTDPDLLITSVRGQYLYRNDEGVYVDVTEESGIAGVVEGWCSSAGFFDYDQDGDLDYFLCNYIEWTRAIAANLDVTLKGIGKAYAPPLYFKGSQPCLFRNEGDGTFTEVAEASGMHVFNVSGQPVAKSLAVTFVDANADGWIDVFVANDTTQNFLYFNNGDGTFEEAGGRSGVAYDSMGNATGAMGIDISYYLNDNALALAIGNFANESTSFYVSNSDSSNFTDESISAGIGSPSRIKLSFGLFFFDYDLDGRLDMVQTNGHLEDEINAVQSSQSYLQSAQLFWNGGIDARRPLVLVPNDSVGDLAEPIVGRGATYADIDDDGDLDVLFTQIAGRPLLLRNDQDLGNHWLRFKLIGTSVNRDAIGAWIVLTTGDITQRRQVMPTKSYQSQVELPVTFGLGEAVTVDLLRITWPDGSVQDVDVTAVDTTMVVTQGDS